MASIINADTSGGLKTTADTSGVLQLQTASTTALTVNASQQVGIGTTSPSTNLYVTGAGSGTFGAYNDPLIVKGSSYSLLYVNGTNGVAATVYNYNSANGWYTGTNNSAYYRIGYMSSIDQTGVSNAKDGATGITIDTSGNVCINQASFNYNSTSSVGLSGTGGYSYFTRSGGYALLVNRITSTGDLVNFTYNGSSNGTVSTNGTNVSYNTSSDYRLKEKIAPMTGALDKVSQLKPCTYTWKATGEDGQGFIAHELQEIFPDAVHGEKDAVDEDGNIKPQGIDTSFLVATLTAAIQELKAELDATKAEVAALKGTV
jgi:hypothetical protein